ncbi:MAG: hypothetical protein U5K43_00355 [Halofilum sp. (in: g-proteobacteria)]|nr:hypothetical protein [Halofilum sp. (in: g-proteobacteria)]
MATAAETASQFDAEGTHAGRTVAALERTRPGVTLDRMRLDPGRAHRPRHRRAARRTSNLAATPRDQVSRRFDDLESYARVRAALDGRGAWC